MDSMIRIYELRSELELRLANALFILSKNSKNIKKELILEDNDTFFSAVITHAYFAIFYAAKALLLTKGIKTEAPEVHKKTLNAFETEFVKNGELDVALLNIYKEMMVRADELLGIFKAEKKKRGRFTYRIIAEANVPFAEESLRRAGKFVRNIFQVLRKTGG
ncbi:MAG: HEPN domain-containing protein [Nanoarchaeota archaeon]|nr:HEPN domain-containing protein [Nanoarchaeota archaeon]